jgi:hypothetical protein
MLRTFCWMAIIFCAMLSLVLLIPSSTAVIWSSPSDAPCTEKRFAAFKLSFSSATVR